MPVTVYARGDSNTANNSSINSDTTNTVPVTQLTFEPATGGDVILEGDGVGGTDPDTLVTVTRADGSIFTTNFTVELTGTLAPKNSLNDVNGFDANNAEIVVVTIVDPATGDSQRYYFLTDETFNSDPAFAADLPNGALNVENLDTTPDVAICFAAGTRIETPEGLRAIEDLRVGDLIITDAGPRPIAWIGSRKLSRAKLKRVPTLQPIRIAAGAMDDALPAKDVVGSPNHRIVLGGARSELLFGAEKVLCAAKYLLDRPGVTQFLPHDGVEYFHVMFIDHRTVWAEGMEAESLFMGAEAVTALDAEAKAEIALLFPELADGNLPDYPAVHPVLKGYEAKLLA
ncbi:Hint domain-containing protein [Aestuariibius sp. 2305UL40-4]|uniref:Hint domain-containing protein n=1 Tax=Aestuariibius violaceus TaxID=3234132 RepID=UPI00345E9057